MPRLLALLLIFVITKINGAPGDFRPPAVPLIVFSPHISGESYLQIIQVTQNTEIINRIGAIKINYQTSDFEKIIS